MERARSCIRLVHSDAARTATLVALSSDNLVVKAAELETVLGPGIEVVAGGDGAAGTLVLTDGPELGEGGCALDRRLVHALAGVDVVVGAIGVDGAAELGAGRGIVGAERLDDVVLDERRGGPAVAACLSVYVLSVAESNVDRTLRGSHCH